MAQQEEHIVSPKLYLIVLAALMVLLLLTLVGAFVDIDKAVSGSAHQGTSYWNMATAVLIAMMKAILIILFFMHVKYSSKLTWAFAGAAFVWLGILLTLSMSDYVTRNYPPSSPKSPQDWPSSTEMRPPPRHDYVVPGANAAPPRVAPTPADPFSRHTGSRTA